jgi:hypothetical protein
MKKYLFPLLVFLAFFSTAQAQLLTEVQDSSLAKRIEQPFYFRFGAGVRTSTGYKQMRNFYQEQGFDYLNLVDFTSIGMGIPLKGRFDLELNMDFPLLGGETMNVQLGNDAELSLRESQYAVHVLPGYRFWEGRYKSLILNGGLTFHLNQVEMVERLQNEFDFETGNRFTPRGSRSIPVFYHVQGALHAALTMRLQYPGSRRFRADQEIKLGFVSGLQESSWFVNPGQAVNTPMDRAQYIYLSGLFHLSYK